MRHFCVAPLLAVTLTVGGLTTGITYHEKVDATTTTLSWTEATELAFVAEVFVSETCVPVTWWDYVTRWYHGGLPERVHWAQGRTLEGGRGDWEMQCTIITPR